MTDAIQTEPTPKQRYNRELYRKNREKRLAQNRVNYQANRDKYLKRYQDNKTEVLKKVHAYREKNRELINKKSSERYHRIGLTAEQKAANKIRRRQDYLKNRDKILAYSKAYHEAHPEVGKRSIAKYLANNRVILRERSREYYRNNRELRIQSAIRSNGKRKAQKNKTEVNPDGIKQWMAEVRTKPFVRCHWCGTKVNGKKIHFDHIIALSKGGAHSISNLCASCQHCNATKHARLIADWVVKGQTFLPI